jgi:hypothetical protein
MDSQRIDRTKWTRYLYPLVIESGKPKVKAISFNLKANHESGTINVTDLQLQTGKQATIQVPHTSEMLEALRHGFDEGTNLADQTLHSTGKQNIKLGPAQPIVYENLKNRVYNIVGRGHEVVSLPNVFHEDYKVELLTSGLELELYAKDDFDLLRISTNGGALVPGRKYPEDAPKTLSEHPLNWKYTREFYFGAGKAGDKITMSSTLMNAAVGNTKYQFGQRSSLANMSKQRLMVAPSGSFRLRIEFYKMVTENIYNEETKAYDYPATYLKDVRIGYYGTAEFHQVKAGNTF